MIITFYVLITIILSGLYFFLLVFILQKWAEIPDHHLPLKSSPRLNISILIPARNEARNIQKCLDSILLNLAKTGHEVEVIVIDDHSTDKTAELVLKYHNSGVHLLQLKNYLEDETINAYKKAALAYGISQAKGEYIIQLDADVIVHEQYLEHVCSALINSNADFIAAPVFFVPNDNLLGHFQCLDMMGMMLLTGAGIESRDWYMANGANMIYKKQHAHYDNSVFASGDDIYTIQNIAKKEENIICFLKCKEAMVFTPAEKTYKSLWRQRLRWATKNRTMTSSKMIMMMAIPFINALWLIGHLIFLIIYGPLAIITGGFHLLSLLAIDYIYLKTARDFFGEEKSMAFFLASFFSHKVYLVFIGLASLFISKYKWKDRVVR